MQTPFAHPAVWRGMLQFAGMLSGKYIRPVRTATTPIGAGALVSWRPGARSRREDELERMRDQAA